MSAQAGTKLRQQAAARGTDVTRYASELVEQALAVQPPSANESATGRLSAWDTFVAEMAKAAKRLPAGAAVDDSRESIYAGRGE